VAWDQLFRFMQLQRARYSSLAAELDLSPVQASVLKELEPGTPVAMHALADALACDASNVTGIVDRLEARGLLERRESPHDRRVRMLMVTERGREVRASLLGRLRRPPQEIASLSRADQRTLARILKLALAARAVTRVD